jgi:hypothetical protein
VRLFSQRIAESMELFPHRRIVECVLALRQFDTLRPARYSAPHL